jgi:hypothetical protein
MPQTSNSFSQSNPMKAKVVLTVSAIYLAFLGIGFMFAPREIGIGAVPADASPALIA